jgi:hypothetical protein
MFVNLFCPCFFKKFLTNCLIYNIFLKIRMICLIHHVRRVSISLSSRLRLGNQDMGGSEYIGKSSVFRADSSDKQERNTGYISLKYRYMLFL